MQKIKKKLTGYLGRGIAAVLALMLVALPCLSFPVFAAKQTNYVGECIIIGADSLSSEEAYSNTYYGSYPVSNIVFPEQYDHIIVLLTEVPVDVYSNFSFRLVSTFNFGGALSSGELQYMESVLAEAYAAFTSNLHVGLQPYLDGEDTYKIDVNGFLDYELDAASGVVSLIYSVSGAVPEDLPSNYKLFAVYFDGIFCFEGLISSLDSSMVLSMEDEITLIGSVGDSMSGILGWAGTVIYNIVSPNGSMYVLLPLFVIGIAIAAIFVGYKIIRSFIWGY